MFQNPREFYLGKCGGGKASHDFFLQCSGSFTSSIPEVFPLSVVKFCTTFSFSLPLMVSYIYIHVVISLGAQIQMVRDNRVTSRKKKGPLRWYEVVGGCDDLEQVPGGSKMKIMLP